MLTSIRLTDFRNFSSCRIELHSGMNCFIGQNGQGKTNLLEAVYYLSLLRSFRTSRLQDLIGWQRQRFVISGQVDSGDSLGLELAVSHGLERKLLLNHNPVYRASDFINQFICITFIPQDLELIQGAPALRRRFMDIAISQFSEPYMRDLQAFASALKSRNAMLREAGKYPQAMITAYDQQMIRTGVTVELARMSFARGLNQQLQQKSKTMFAPGRKLSVKYLSRLGYLLQSIEEENPARVEEAYRQGLAKSLERDLRNGNTSIGPHRADLSCLLDERALSQFGSQGECRMASLTLRFACLELIKTQRGDNDVTLIVDDVLGELDRENQQRFLQELQQSQQVLLAATELPRQLPGNKQIFHLQAGKVSYQGKHEE